MDTHIFVLRWGWIYKTGSDLVEAARMKGCNLVSNQEVEVGIRNEW